MRRIVFLFVGAIVGVCGCSVHGVEVGNKVGLERKENNFFITTVAQFRLIPREGFLGRCAFRLGGIATLVDTNRNLLVLQDKTGAVALSPKNGLQNVGVQFGQHVVMEGDGCFPSIAGLPNYPYLPSAWDLRPSFDAPTNWGEYHLTRMRGYLHPPVTGKYTFWIASDNSSELWLSSDEAPTNVRRIAFIPRYWWVRWHEWASARFSEIQRSAQIPLEARHAYYIEAFQEQTTQGEHLAVAWQGPTLDQSVIEGLYLSPSIENAEAASLAGTNGLIREYWTNFTSGALDTVTGPRTFESVLSVDKMQIKSQGAAALPIPVAISLSQRLKPEDNYRWVTTQGNVTFAGTDGGVSFLEVSDGERRVQVRISGGNPKSLGRFHNSSICAEGVCEGVYGLSNAMVPGVIWVAKEENISLVQSRNTNLVSIVGEQSLTNGNPATVGFYNTRGVITFNDRVFGKEYMFVQEETAAFFVSLKGRNFENQFEVGHWVDLGGFLQPGKNIPVLNPLGVTELGSHSMPVPMTQPVQFPVSGNRDGRWTELEGVVHSVNPNGTLVLAGSGGPLSVWIGKTSTNSLSPYVDAKLRVRGVLSLTIQDTPLLLVPALRYVDVLREAPQDPFLLPTHLSEELLASEADTTLSHRVKLSGHVTFSDKQSFFMQDSSGGIRVQPVESRELQLGQAVEVVGFLTANRSVRALAEALVRPAGNTRDVPSQKLAAGEGISFKHAGTLVQISANLIAQRNASDRQVLELQEKQRVFEAELPPGLAQLPKFLPGSRLRLTGVCDFPVETSTDSESTSVESPSTGALKIWLRSPTDVVLVSGPPWWTWKYTAALVGTLLAVSVVSLLRIHLLRRRLERHLTFSRQILESQEKERRRIAVNLHDGLGQNLSVIKYQARLAMQPTTDHSVLRHRLDQISGCASEAIEDVREITQALRPYQLDRLGLTQAIRATVNHAAENGPVVFASHADDIDGLFDKESEIHLYRSVQEALNNILKHSKASEATVVVKKSAGAVSLSVRDNGRGFDAEGMYNNNSQDVGHGISSIHERVRILGGTFAIDSRPDQGTSLNIEIPIPVSRHET